MIMQPEFVTAEMVAKALDRGRFEACHEGLSAQIMHLGLYDAEGPTIARLHSFIQGNCYEPSRKHHEIYLSDPRRTAPEKLKPILRQPFRKQA